MNQATDKQKKIVMIIVAVFLGSYVLRYAVTSVIGFIYAYQMRSAQAAAENKPQDGRGGSGGRGTVADTGPNVKVPGSVAQIDPAFFSRLVGFWDGKGKVEGRGYCDLRIELQEPEPGLFAGYPRFSCLDYSPQNDAKLRSGVAAAVAYEPNPNTAVLSGTVENGTLRFKVEKVLGNNNCAVTSFMLTPSGTNLLGAEWQQQGCPVGKMLLAKEPK
jgi:hypothetical protein